MSYPAKNPARQQLQLLLGAHGFNFYDNAVNARADDLLIRQAASARLGAAASSLAKIEQDYHKRFIPPSTRENPYPSAHSMAPLKAIMALKSRVSGIEARLRGLSTPTSDKVWWRFRTEVGTLEQLLNCDTMLIQQAEIIQQTAENMTADSWNADPESRSLLDSPLSQFERAMQERQMLLQMPH